MTVKGEVNLKPEALRLSPARAACTAASEPRVTTPADELRDVHP